jgi:hypothetical protein
VQIQRQEFEIFNQTIKRFLHPNATSNASNLVELQVNSQAWIGISLHLGKQIVDHSQSDETIRHTYKPFAMPRQSGSY